VQGLPMVGAKPTHAVQKAKPGPKVKGKKPDTEMFDPTAFAATLKEG
jgi:hypothetical protein